MFKQTKLSNGLRLVLAPLKETKAVTVLVLVNVGSRHESKNINGVSHFVEHLLFKGTKKRPTSIDLTKELDGVGAEYNAFTAKDHTGYYIKVTAEKIELAFDILSDMIFNSTFAAAEIQKERGVILEEINMYNDNPLMNLGSLFETTIFGNQPVGWSIAGPKSVIKKVTRRELVNYKNKFYQPNNMVVSVSGNFNTTKVNNLAKKYFGQKNQNKLSKSAVKASLKQSRPKVNVSFKDSQQVQMGLGFPAYSLTDKMLYAEYILAIILGGNMSSRLFGTVRERFGLAYFIRTDLSAYNDVGAFMVQAGLDKRRIDQAITLILSELKKAKDEGITDAELEDAKQYLKGKFVLELEDSEHVADWFGKQQLLLNKISTPEERIKKIMAVTKEDVEKAAKHIFDDKKINLALIGPFKDKTRFTKLLKF